MKIAQVTLRFDAPGGVETNVREVSRRLHNAGEAVTVYASDLYNEAGWDRRSNYRPIVEGVPVRRFPVYRRLVPGLTLPLFRGLISALDEDAPEIIHAHSHRYGHVLEAATVAHRRAIPFVVSLHYHPADRRESAWKRGLLRCQDVAFGATAYRIASALIVESEYEAALAREFAPADRIRVIPPGVDLEEWSTPEADELPPGLPPRYLLYAGRIASNKGLDVLLRAYARLDAEGRPGLVLLGPDWGETGRLRALARTLSIQDGVVFLGALDRRAAYRATMRGASAFVLASEWEAFGLVLLEAMAARVPIVATSVGAVPEVLERGRAGVLVPFGDEPALARALREVVEETPRREALVNAGLERVAQLTWDRSANRYRELYRALTGGDRSRA